MSGRPTGGPICRSTLAEVGIGIYRGSAEAVAPGQWDLVIEGRFAGQALVPVAQPRRAELGISGHAGDARLFALREGPGCGTVAYRSCGRGRPLRRLHGQDRARAVGDSRCHAGARQPDRPPGGAGMEGGRRSIRRCFIDRLAELGYKAYPFEPVRAETIEKPSRRASCCAASASPRLPP